MISRSIYSEGAIFTFRNACAFPPSPPGEMCKGKCMQGYEALSTGKEAKGVIARGLEQVMNGPGNRDEVHILSEVLFRIYCRTGGRAEGRI